MRTSLCLQFPPQKIASAAIYLAAAYLEIEVPAHLRDRWDERLNLSADDLDQIVTKILAVYRAGAAKILAR
jgi:hypothetical protein